MNKETQPCSSCGAAFGIDMNFCPYCGTSVPKNENTRTININKNINKNVNINKRYEDAAEIKKIDSDEKIKIKELKLEKNDRIWTYIIIFITLFFIPLAGLIFLHNASKLDEDEFYISKSSSEYIGYNYQELYDEFSAMGFAYITLSEISDLKYNSTKINLVTNISIGGNSKFDEGESFSKNDKVIITYHTVKQPAENETILKTNLSSYIKKPYVQAVTELQAMGFTNITTEGLDDLVTGWIIKENTIDQITINGKADLKDGDILPQDAQIVIKYHSKD